MAYIDQDKLRAYLIEYYGSASQAGFPASLLDVGILETLSREELCKKAEDLGIDLRHFTVE